MSVHMYIHAWLIYTLTNTRVSKTIICNEDKNLMQEDLKSIYKWALDNKMEFNVG